MVMDEYSSEEAQLLAPTPGPPAPIPPQYYGGPETTECYPVIPHEVQVQPPAPPAPPVGPVILKQFRDNSTQSYPCDQETCIRTQAMRVMIEEIEEFYGMLKFQDAVPLRSKLMVSEKTNRRLALKQIDKFQAVSPGHRQAAKALIYEATAPLRDALITSAPLTTVIRSVDRSLGTLYSYALDKTFPVKHAPEKQETAGPSHYQPGRESGKWKIPKLSTRSPNGDRGAKRGKGKGKRRDL